MPIFGGGGPCKQMVKYDGASLDLTGLNIPVLATAGSGPLNFTLGHLQIKRFHSANLRFSLEEFSKPMDRKVVSSFSLAGWRG